MRICDSPTLMTRRLALDPLRPEDAEEMVEVLADERIHEFIGGRPASLNELRARYRKLAAGAASPDEAWFNWIVRRRSDGQPLGYVQATVIEEAAGQTAYVAWVIGVPWQNQGFASEAAQGLVSWLHKQGVGDIRAHIHPDHLASGIVASRAGLVRSGEQVEGEQVWRAAKAEASGAPA